MRDIVQEIKEFVEEECKKPSSKYGYEVFFFFFEREAEYADRVSDGLGGVIERILIVA